ncbi:MAG: SMC-Scp complex subunit ScpB [Pseudomonadota bacterium]
MSSDPTDPTLWQSSAPDPDRADPLQDSFLAPEDALVELTQGPQDLSAVDDAPAPQAAAVGALDDPQTSATGTLAPRETPGTGSEVALDAVAPDEPVSESPQGAVVVPADLELPPLASVDSILDMGGDGAAGEGDDAEGSDDDLAAQDVANGAEALPDLVPIIEALLFTADRPVTVQALSATLRAEHPSVRAPAIRAALKQLLQAYADDGRVCGRGFVLSEVSSGFVFRTDPTFARYLQRFTSQKPQRLSRAALETLAVIAYRQPVTRPQVDDVRGVDSSSAVKYLLDKSLIRVLGKSEEVGRPLLYGTTADFLELFSLKGLSHLPTLQEYQELDADNQAKVDALPGPVPVRVIDLASVDGRVVSESTERDSEGALSDLENAVAEAEQRRRESDQSLGPGSAAAATQGTLASDLEATDGFAEDPDAPLLEEQLASSATLDDEDTVTDLAADEGTLANDAQDDAEETNDEAG